MVWEWSLTPYTINLRRSRREVRVCMSFDGVQYFTHIAVTIVSIDNVVAVIHCNGDRNTSHLHSLKRLGASELHEEHSTSDNHRQTCTHKVVGAVAPKSSPKWKVYESSYILTTRAICTVVNVETAQFDGKPGCAWNAYEKSYSWYHFVCHVAIFHTHSDSRQFLHKRQANERERADTSDICSTTSPNKFSRRRGSAPHWKKNQHEGDWDMHNQQTKNTTIFDWNQQICYDEI